MSSRHLARTVAFQSLFEWDMRGNPTAALPAIVERNLKMLAPGIKDGSYAHDIANGVIEHQTDIDALIAAFAPEWPIAQITPIDRNILRVGVFELKINPEIPVRVAINEAIEIAKTFGGNASGKFVNGVLGAMYKKMEEKGEMKEVDKKTELNKE